MRKTPHHQKNLVLLDFLGICAPVITRSVTRYAVRRAYVRPYACARARCQALDRVPITCYRACVRATLRHPSRARALRHPSDLRHPSAPVVHLDHLSCPDHPERPGRPERLNHLRHLRRIDRLQHRRRSKYLRHLRYLRYLRHLSNLDRLRRSRASTSLLYIVADVNLLLFNTFYFIKI